MVRLYRYVGSRSIAERCGDQPMGATIRTPEDVRAWLANQPQTVIVTYVIDEAGDLLIADRHSEHVACAGGKQVRSAGEMTFHLTMTSVEVTAVSNQSTGYCPEPESWGEVVAALSRIGLASPGTFMPMCVFRRCEKCATLNIVKDGVFECGVCGMELAARYNVQ